MEGKGVVPHDEDDAEEAEGQGAENVLPDEEEDEEEEGNDEYEKDDFIVDDYAEEEAEAEEERSDTESRSKKRKRKRRSKNQFLLDEDDYELIHDNNLTGFRYPGPGSKKFKRLRKGVGHAEEGERSVFSNEAESSRNASAEEKLRTSLFGHGEGVPEDIADEEDLEEVDSDIGEEDDMADFIVEDEDDSGVLVKRKKTGKGLIQMQDVPSSAVVEAQEIFGDVDELVRLRKQSLAQSGAQSLEDVQRRLEHGSEPSILEQKYMTQQDDNIRQTDIPERIQLFESITGPPPVDDLSLEEETSWIFDQLAGVGVCHLFSRDKVFKDIEEEDIRNVLNLFHKKKLDIPFIATYRKELCLSLVLQGNEEDERMDDDDVHRKPGLKWHKALWAVHDLDRRWLLLQKRKNKLQTNCTRRVENELQRTEHAERRDLIGRLLDAVVKDLRSAKSEREVDDVDNKFKLHFPPGDPADVREGQFKRPIRRTRYSACYRAGLWQVSNMFGYSAQQVGRILQREHFSPELEDPKASPLEVAARFTCAGFDKPEDVLEGARHMASMEISCEPSIKKHVREKFMADGLVSTSTTPEGDSVIDSFHPFAGVKHVESKPLAQFLDAQWLLIQKAEEQRLLQVRIQMPEEKTKAVEEEIKTIYVSFSVSVLGQEWNEQRELILKDALFEFLFPSMEKEVRSLLTSRAKQWLRMEYGKHFWRKVSVAPYQQSHGEWDSEEKVALPCRVMSCCCDVPGNRAATFAMLNSAGELTHVLHASSINAPSGAVDSQKYKEIDQKRLADFMMEQKPDVIGVGASNLSCKRLKDEVNEVIYNIMKDHASDVALGFGAPEPVFCDESLPNLYEKSRDSSNQLPEQPGIVKRAVALGRYLQNPLAMIATLCGREREILTWKLCPLEEFLTPDEKYDVVEKIMVDVTNQVGVDINLAASHRWLFAPLQFVSGLGPRKASALEKALTVVGSVSSRKEVIRMGYLTKKVFFNAAGFLRVCRSGAAAAARDHVLDLLDDARIHPESYDLAKTMAKLVYAYDLGENANDLEDDVQELAIELVREKPHMLKALNIDEYAKSVQDGQKRETLYDIMRELQHGFYELRTPYTAPSEDEVFSMISGETDETLSAGRIVQVKVRSVQEQRIVCSLDSGLKGIIYKKDIGGDYEVLKEKIHAGDSLTCKIKSVRKDLCLVYLTCEESELRSWVSPHGQHSKMNVQSEIGKVFKGKAKGQYHSKVITNPHFQDITRGEAEKLLSGRGVGESIVRPGSMGPPHLTLTLKVYEGVYNHIGIIEGHKDQATPDMLRPGNILKIGKHSFEDLEEVMRRYVEPLVAHLKNMLGHRKFRKGTKKEVDEILRSEKAAYPMIIVYSLGVSHECPGSFILTYIRNSDPRHEYITLCPEGFVYRMQLFNKVDRLVEYFQAHINDPPPQSAPAPAIGSVAAPVDSGRAQSSARKTGEWGSLQTDPAGSSGVVSSVRGSMDRSGGVSDQLGSGRGDGLLGAFPGHYGGGNKGDAGSWESWSVPSHRVGQGAAGSCSLGAGGSMGVAASRSEAGHRVGDESWSSSVRRSHAKGGSWSGGGGNPIAGSGSWGSKGGGGSWNRGGSQGGGGGWGNKDGSDKGGGGPGGKGGDGGWSSGGPSQGGGGEGGSSGWGNKDGSKRYGGGGGGNKDVGGGGGRRGGNEQ